jgi:hypothetical protein
LWAIFALLDPDPLELECSCISSTNKSSFSSRIIYYMCAESDDDVSPSQPRGDEAELQGIRHPQVPQSPGKTSVKPLADLHNLPFIVDIGNSEIFAGVVSTVCIIERLFVYIQCLFYTGN